MAGQSLLQLDSSAGYSIADVASGAASGVLISERKMSSKMSLRQIRFVCQPALCNRLESGWVTGVHPFPGS